MYEKSKIQQEMPPCQCPMSPCQGPMPPCQNQMRQCQDTMPPYQGPMPPCQGPMPPCQNQMGACQDPMPPYQGPMPPYQGPMVPCQNQMGQCQDTMPPCQGPMPPCQGPMSQCQNQMGPCQDPMSPYQNQMPPCQGPMPPCQGQMPPCQKQMGPCQGSTPCIPISCRACEDPIHGNVCTSCPHPLRTNDITLMNVNNTLTSSSGLPINVTDNQERFNMASRDINACKPKIHCELYYWINKDKLVTDGLTLYQIIENSSNHTTLFYILKLLNSELGPYFKSLKYNTTFFAPSNEAFIRLKKEYPDFLEKILNEQNRQKLKELVQYHMLGGNYTVITLEDGKKYNTESKSSNSSGNGTRTIQAFRTIFEVMINNSLIELPDVKGVNGVIHSIKRVLVPQNFEISTLLVPLPVTFPSAP